MAEIEYIRLKDDDSSLLSKQFKSLLLHSDIKWWVILIVSCLFLIVSCVLWIISTECYVWEKILIVTSWVMIASNAVLIQIKWNNKFATVIAVIFMIMVFLFVIDAISPIDAAKQIGEIAKDIAQ